jgi:hypothetical protein
VNDEPIYVNGTDAEGKPHGVVIDFFAMRRIEELERENAALKTFLRAVCYDKRPEAGGYFRSPIGPGVHALQALWDDLFGREEE